MMVHVRMADENHPPPAYVLSILALSVCHDCCRQVNPRTSGEALWNCSRCEPYAQHCGPLSVLLAAFLPETPASAVRPREANVSLPRAVEDKNAPMRWGRAHLLSFGMMNAATFGSCDGKGFGSRRRTCEGNHGHVRTATGYFR
jgi:hypothetical protein